MISLHSHSGQFCRHAKGQLEEVVLEAIRQGFQTYGLSEHVPRYCQEDLYPEEAGLALQDLEDTFDAYIKEGVQLKAKYASQIQLLVGLETECINPDSLSRLQALLAKHHDEISYIVGSLHHVKGIPIDFDRATFDKALESFTDGQDGLSQLDQLFCSYFDTQYDLLLSCQPEVVGHFDLCRLYLPAASFKNPQVWSRVERNVDTAIRLGALFEINAAAFRKGWRSAYPGPDVLQLIKERGGRFTLSDDSHGPHAVGLHYKDAHLYLVEQEIHDLWCLTTSDNEDDNKPPAEGGTELAGGGKNSTDDGGRQILGVRRKTRAIRLDGDWQRHPFWMNE